MMQKKWILVTGGSRGIGAALVQHLAREYVVVFTWKDQQSRAESLLNECRALSLSVSGYRCDGSKPTEVKALAQQLLTQYGAPFGIIHNAGITRDALHFKQDINDWETLIGTNLNAVFYWNQQLLPSMMEQGSGSIVMISSVSALKGNIGQVAYSASKAAMLGMARSLAREVARFNIRVNCVLPGLIETEMTTQMSDLEQKALKSAIPLRRLGRANEVAQATAYLISEASSYMTGQSLVLDGGMSA